jgi:type IV pilus assembly protein PilE
MARTGHERGFSLLELMIAVAIIAVLSTLAFPFYTDYIESARQAVLSQNIDSMRIFQEDFRLRTGAYSAEDWAPGDAATETGWLPDQDGAGVTYTVTLVGDSYRVEADDGNICYFRNFADGSGGACP